MILYQWIGVIYFYCLADTAYCYIRDRAFNKNVSQTLDNLLMPGRYDKRIRPNIGGPPITVEVDLYIKSIGPITEIEQLYTMDLYFRQSWYDKRLCFELPGLNEFSMSWLFLDKIWKPDTYFTNGKKSYLHRITSPNRFVRVRNDGYLMYSSRYTISATCRMYLKKFPMDTQRCPLYIGSYGYTSRDLMYRWKTGGGVRKEKGLELAQFELINITTKDQLFDIRGPMEFSVVKATFILKRNLGYFVLQMYVPCILMVCSSWVNFWIDPDATPARVQLSVTSVLAITTLGFVGRSALPKVAYPTALDWFLITCFVFVFAVLIEYAVINLIDKVTEDIKKLLQEREKRKKDQELATQLLQEQDQSITENGNYSTNIENDNAQPIALKTSCVDDNNLSPSIAIPKIIIHSETMSAMDGSQPRTQTVIEQGIINFDLEMADIEMIDKSDCDLEDDLSIQSIPGKKIPKTKFCVPFHILKRFRILPTELEISKKEIKEKFTKIDTRSRVIFPTLFTSVMIIYVLLYTYVVVDNIDYVED